MDNNLIASVIRRKVDLVESTINNRVGALDSMCSNDAESGTCENIINAYWRFFQNYYHIMGEIYDLADADFDNAEQILAIMGISPLAVNRKEACQ